MFVDKYVIKEGEILQGTVVFNLEFARFMTDGQFRRAVRAELKVLGDQIYEKFRESRK